MQFTLQILVILTTFMLTMLGVMSMFAPKKMLSNFALEPVGNAGMNTVRSVIGGFFLAAVTMLVFSQITSQTLGYIPVAIMMLAVAIGRVVGLVLDGADKAVIPPLLLELVIAAVLLTAHYQAA